MSSASRTSVAGGSGGGNGSDVGFEDITVSFYDLDGGYSDTGIGGGGDSLATFSLQAAFTMSTGSGSGVSAFGQTWAEANSSYNNGARQSYSTYRLSGQGASYSSSMPSEAAWEADDRSFGMPFWAASGNQACSTKTKGNNCTEACNGGFGDMFDYLPTLHNCILLPNITNNTQQNVSLTYYNDHGQHLLDEYFYQPAAKAVGENVISKVTQCLQDYCISLPGCEDYMQRNSIIFINDTSPLYGNYGFGNAVTQAICHSVPTQVLSDVGGIGVYLSYWIQPGIALLAFHLTIFWAVLGPYAYLCAYAIFRGPKGARKRIEKADKMSQRHLSRLAVALVDFHKTQCFFMVATNIAAIVVIRTAGLQPSSLQQAYNTFYLLRMVAVNGYLPVTFCLFNLHVLSMASWYLILLSLFSIAFSLSTLAVSGSFGPSKSDIEYLKNQAKMGGPTSCEGRQPGVYCWLDYSNTNGGPDLGSIASGSLLAFCLTIFVFLVLAKSRSTLWKRLVRTKPKWAQGWQRTKATWSVLMKDRRVVRTVASVQVAAISIWEHPRTRKIVQSTVDTSLKAWTSTAIFYRAHPLPPQINKYAQASFTLTCTVGKTVYLYTLHRFQRYHRDHHNQKSYVYTLGLLLLYAAYIIFYAIYFQYFVALFRQLKTIASQDFTNPTWNFGQVVALSVWLPPLFEWIYLELRGVRKGFRYRLRANHYEVVRRDEKRSTCERDEDFYGDDVERGPESKDDGHELRPVSGLPADASDKEGAAPEPEKPQSRSQGAEDHGMNRTRSPKGAHLEVYDHDVEGMMEQTGERDLRPPSRPPSYRVQPSPRLHEQRSEKEDETRYLRPQPSAQTISSVSSSSHVESEQGEREDDRYWLLPEPELPSRSITLSGAHGTS